ncbi:MAG: hypothetical protein QOH88_474 [Verrucomicrobiota bacterium]
MLLLPVVFIGGCTLAIRPLWAWKDRTWVRAVGDADKKHFPVLVRDSSGTYSTAPLEAVPEGSSIVTADFDQTAINRDLNASVGSSAGYDFFRVLAQTPHGTSVSLEVPMLRDSKLQTWYEISDGHVLPKQILRYGPGFAFVVLPWAAACGLAAAVVFALIIRRKSPRLEAAKT